MSTDWNIHCADCGVSGNDDYSRAEYVCDLIRVAPMILAMADEADVEIVVNYHQASIDWLRQHCGHRLVARSEYGEIDGTCGKRVACPTCSHEFGRCVCDPGHDGPCVAKDRNGVSVAVIAPPVKP